MIKARLIVSLEVLVATMIVLGAATAVDMLHMPRPYSMLASMGLALVAYCAHVFNAKHWHS